MCVGGEASYSCREEDCSVMPPVEVDAYERTLPTGADVRVVPISASISTSNTCSLSDAIASPFAPFRSSSIRGGAIPNRVDLTAGGTMHDVR